MFVHLARIQHKVVLLALRTVFAVGFWLPSFLQLKLWARIRLQIEDSLRLQFTPVYVSTFTNVLALHFKVKFDRLFVQRVLRSRLTANLQR